MRNIWFFLSVMLVTVLSAQDICPGCYIDQIASRKALMWSSFPEHGQLRYTIGNNYDLKYYRFFWDVDPAVKYIRGSVTSHFVITQPNTQIIQFELSDALIVDSIMYHGLPVSFTHTNKTISIELPVVLNQGQIDSVTIWYQGEPVSTGGFSSFTTSLHNGVPVLWTLSQPYGSSDWWPCKNVLNDKIDSLDIYIRTPAEYKAASIGMLVDSIYDGTFKIYHWRHRYPIETYLVAMAVTNYDIISIDVPLSTGVLPVVNYVYPEHLPGVATEVLRVVPCLEFYDTLIGSYPFMNEKYGHAQFGWGGGMEHQTMSFMGGFSHELIAHELVHMWFGDAITCGSWQDIWLNEGFATYFTGLTYEHMFGGQYWMSWKQSTVNNIVSEPWGSVWCDDTTNIWRIFDGRLSYRKGAYLLHMLRWVMGDSMFFQTIKNYYNDPLLRFGYARSSDFIAHAEAVYGQSLQWFFDQWLYGQGYPRYFVYATIRPDSTVHIRLAQQQSHPSVSFFRMPVPVRFFNSQHDTIVVFNHLYNNQEFEISLPFKPSQVRFDPELWLISGYNTIYVNVETFDSVEQIKAYPNPVAETLYIELMKPSEVLVMITDMQGKIMYNERIFIPHRAELDISKLKTGAYILYIQSPNSHLHMQILKM